MPPETTDIAKPRHRFGTIVVFTKRETGMSDFDTLFEAVRRADLRDVLGRRYTIRRDGFFEENPVRQEDHSSIRIRSDDHSRWFDFGSREGGDLIHFLERAEGISVEAARELAAELLGVPVPSTSRTREGASVKPHTRKRSGGRRFTPKRGPPASWAGSVRRPRGRNPRASL